MLCIACLFSSWNFHKLLNVLEAPLPHYAIKSNFTSQTFSKGMSFLCVRKEWEEGELTRLMFVELAECLSSLIGTLIYVTT